MKPGMRRGLLARLERRAVMGIALVAVAGCSLLPFPGLKGEQSVVPSVSEGRTMDLEITVKLPDADDGRQVAYNGPALGYNNDINMLMVGIFEHGSTTTPSFGYLFQGAVGANPDAQVLNVDTAPWVTVGTGAIKNLVGTVINSDFSAKSDDYRRYSIRNYGTGTGFQSGTTTTKFSNIPLADAGGLHRYLVFAAAYDAGSPEAALLGYTEVNLALTSPVQPASDSVGYNMSGAMQLDLELNRNVLESPNAVSQSPVLTAFAPGAAKAYVPLTNVTAVAAGGYHSLALRSDGTVWAWGENGGGQLGDGTVTNRLYAVQVPGLSGVTKIAAGALHSFAVKSDGSVYGWGNNDYGQLGDGSSTTRKSPVQIFPAGSAVEVACGHWFSLARLNDGTLSAWGANGSGQLGDGTTTDRLSPVTVSVISSVTAISAGNAHSLARKSDGTLWSWGSNDNGQLGNGDTNPVSTPAQIPAPILTGMTGVAGGTFAFTLAVKGNGTLWSWGYNNDGELGDGTTNERFNPVAVVTSGVLNGRTMSKVVAGEKFGLAMENVGSLFSWGYNGNGQLGDGTTTGRLAPVAVVSTSLGTASAIAAGKEHGLAVGGVPGGNVFSWGLNGSGQLGDGTTTTRTAPVNVKY